MAISGPPGCYGVPFGFILEAHRTGNVYTGVFAFLWEPAGRLSFPDASGGTDRNTRRLVAAICTTTHKTGMQVPSYAPKCHTRPEKPDLRSYFRLEAMVVI